MEQPKTASSGSTPAKYCKSRGLKSLKELSDMSGKHPETLRRWFYEEDPILDLIIDGCLYRKSK